MDGCLVRRDLESCSPGLAELDSYQKGSTTLKHTDDKRKEEEREGGKKKRRREEKKLGS